MFVVIPTMEHGRVVYCTEGEFQTCRESPVKVQDAVDECPAIIYATTERNAAYYLDVLTRKFPNISFGVFKLQSVGVRPVGEMVTKVVSEKGVLPS